MGQKGKNVKYVRAYLEEGEEAKEIGVRDGVRLREIETDFGCKGCSQNAAFQVRILYFFFFPLPPCPRRTTRALDVGLNTHTIHKIIIFI